jgi:cell division transport system permease protein
MKSWLNTHLQALKLVLFRMRTNLLSTMLIAMAVGVAICLPGLFYLTVDHFSQFSTTIQNENEISVFLDLKTSKDTIAEIDEVLTNHPQIKQHRFAPKEEAWAQLKAKSQNAQNNSVTELLDENPLPDAFYIQANASEPDALETLKKDLQQIPNVDHVLLNTDWTKRLAAILAIAKKIIFFIALLLAIALIVIIGNTIRMQILTQQDEIEVSYLIGATNSFIRTPFLYAGFLYGLFGGLVGIGIILFSVNRFNAYITSLSNLYNSDFSLAIFDNQLLIAILFAAVAIGWLGAFLAVNRAIAAMIASQKRH